MQGGVDLAIAQIFDPTLTSGGKMVFDINAQGYRSQPNVAGPDSHRECQLRDA